MKPISSSAEDEDAADDVEGMLSSVKENRLKANANVYANANANAKDNANATADANDNINTNANALLIASEFVYESLLF